MSNEQETFWATTFGTEYTQRNQQQAMTNARALGDFFLRATRTIRSDDALSILELGAGAGQNLEALNLIYPRAVTAGVEINPEAARILTDTAVDVLITSALNIEPGSLPPADLVLTKGFLIHIAPADLPRIYALIHASATHAILIAEYYNPTPVAVPYRGFDNKLWKRDFAGDLLDAYPDLRLVDYGFAYHRGTDSNTYPFPQDDLTWFLLKKH